MSHSLRTPERVLSRAQSRFNVRELNVDTGEFTGLACPFGSTDSYGTAFDPGCFAQSLADQASRGIVPAMLSQHDWDAVIGRWLKIEETPEGLHVAGRLELNTQKGREALALLKPDPTPALNGLSIGFSPDWEAVRVVGDVLIFERVHLWEISLVTFPAHLSARVEVVRAAESVRTQRELERFLRDAGVCSKAEAVALASRFTPKDASAQRDAAQETPSFLRLLEAAHTALKG